jgi:hypothetical protein
MIGNPKWFKYRIFGWGVSPKTWQGWVYVGLAATIIGFATAASKVLNLGPWIPGIVIAILVADVIHIMTQLSKHQDERENMHQLIVERNCSFAAIVALLAVAMWQTYQNQTFFASGGTTGFPFDTSILIVLGAMLVAKVASTAYVKVKM